MSAGLKRLKPITHVKKNDKAAPSRFQRLLVGTEEDSHDPCGPIYIRKTEKGQRQVGKDPPTIRWNWVHASGRIQWKPAVLCRTHEQQKSPKIKIKIKDEQRPHFPPAPPKCKASTGRPFSQ